MAGPLYMVMYAVSAIPMGKYQQLSGPLCMGMYAASDP